MAKRSIKRKSRKGKKSKKIRKIRNNFGIQVLTCGMCNKFINIIKDRIYYHCSKCNADYHNERYRCSQGLDDDNDDGDVMCPCGNVLTIMNQ